MNTNSSRSHIFSQNGQRSALPEVQPIAKQEYSRRRQLEKVTLWVHSSVKRELERRAKSEALSLSKVGATGLEAWLHWDLCQQQDELLFPKLRQLLHEDRQASENRIVFFLMRIAFAAEQSRILTTNVLKWVLKLFWISGKPLKTEKTQDFNEIFHRLVDDSSLLAERNILTRTQRMRRLHEEWKASHQDEEKKGKAHE